MPVPILAILVSKMFTVIYSFCWYNIVTNYVDYDVIRGQKVTYKLPK